MPARARRSTIARSRSARRRLVWAQQEATASMTANGQWTTIDLLSTYETQAGAVEAGITIMRTHLWVLAHSPAAGDLFWLGLSVLDRNDLSGPTTVAQIPNPQSQPFVDWAFVNKYEFDSNTFLSNKEHGFGNAVVLDLKAKRRCHQVGLTWALTILQQTVGTPAKTYDVFARTLLALP